MPTYEYSCPKCGVFEQFHSISTVLTECPHCGSRVQRLISRNNNVIFKGSGFYTTDYKSSDHKTRKAADKSSSAASSTPMNDAKSADTKAENKASSSTKNESKAS